MGEVVAFAEIVQMRRRRVVRQLHGLCLMILSELVSAPVRERTVRVARLRKLEELEVYAAGLG